MLFTCRANTFSTASFLHSLAVLKHRHQRIPLLRSSNLLSYLRLPPNHPPLANFSSSPFTIMSAAAVEAAKRAAAERAVAEHFDPSSHTYIGIGSGTTIVHVVHAILTRISSLSPAPTLHFIPTGAQSAYVLTSAGLTPTLYSSLPATQALDVAFDGADEADSHLNLIKGGGACLFQEKLVATRARKWVCVADYRKLQDRLLTGWTYIPIEVAPFAANEVLGKLAELGSEGALVRLGKDSAVPLVTDQGFWIVDAPFKGPLRRTAGDSEGEVGAWDVEGLKERIRGIVGVLEVGIFSGMDGPEAAGASAGAGAGGEKPVAIYFGMQDGSVKVRTKQGTV